MCKTLETAESYTELEFPFDIPSTAPGVASYRLYEALGDRVVGVSWFGRDPEDIKSAIPYLWKDSGLWEHNHARGISEHMNLPVLPAHTAKVLRDLSDQADTLRARLAQFRDAPEEWRSIDERKLSELVTQIEKLSPKPVDPEGEV